MKTFDSNLISDLFAQMRRAKVVSIEHLCHPLGCSEVTARKLMKEHRAYTSFNHNARYYALPETANFDEDGLWFLKNIGFSRHGNLTRSIIQLIAKSESGLSLSQLKDKLHIKHNSFQSLIREHPQLWKEKHGGRAVYFSLDKTTFKQQKNARIEQLARSKKTISDTTALWIIVERLKYPEVSLKIICKRLKKKTGPLDWQQVDRFFLEQGLDVKKTPPSAC